MTREAGVNCRCRFEVADAKNYPGDNYDLAAFFDCRHDMGDLVSAANQVPQSLAADGTWLNVEPFAGESVAGTLLTPLPRVPDLLRRLDKRK